MREVRSEMMVYPEAEFWDRPHQAPGSELERARAHYRRASDKLHEARKFAKRSDLALNPIFEENVLSALSRLWEAQRSDDALYQLVETMFLAYAKVLSQTAAAIPMLQPFLPSLAELEVKTISHAGLDRIFDPGTGVFDPATYNNLGYPETDPRGAEARAAMRASPYYRPPLPDDME
jgi:hypothetical protein